MPLSDWWHISLKIVDSQPVESKIDPVSIGFHVFDLLEVVSRHPDQVFVVFSVWSVRIELFELFGEFFDRRSNCINLSSVWTLLKTSPTLTVTALASTTTTKTTIAAIGWRLFELLY